MGIRRIRPDIYVKDIFNIDYDLLWKKGYRHIVFDLDHTLLSPRSNRLNKGTRKLIKSLKKRGFKISFLTNTVVWLREERARLIQKSAKTPVNLVCCNVWNCKPKRWGFNEVCKLSGILPEQSIMVGDMLLRDTYGAQEAGFGYTILVRPHGPDNIFILRCRRQERKIKDKLIEMGMGIYQP